MVADQIGAPTSAELIADVTALSISTFYADRLPEGLYHLAASGKVNWHALACHIMDRAHEKSELMKLASNRIKAIATEEYPLPAVRPRNSCLDNSALSQKLGFQFPDWSRHVDHIVEQLVQAEPA